MCTPHEADLIRKETGLWIQRGKSFTSVDIGNSLKQRGDWIKNREVAAYLRDNVLNIAPQYTQGRFNYAASPITVTLKDGSSVQAQLYHPDNASPYDYKTTSQRALSPDEAQADNPTDAQKGASPFAGLAGTADGIFVGMDNPRPSEAEKEDDWDKGSTDDRFPTLGGPMVKSVGLKARPTQDVTINVEHVNNLVITTGEVEFEQED